MPFTPTQRDDIGRYLGYPAPDPDNATAVDLWVTLNGKIDAAEDGAAVEASIVTLLARIAAVDTAVNTSGASTQARGALKAIVGDAEFYELASSDRMLTTIEYGGLLVERLCQRLSLDPETLPGDYFGSGRSLGAGIAGGELVSW